MFQEPVSDGKDTMTHGQHREACDRIEKVLCLKVRHNEEKIDTCEENLNQRVDTHRYFLVAMFICLLGGGALGVFSANNTKAMATDIENIKVDHQELKVDVIDRIDELENDMESHYDDLNDAIKAQGKQFTEENKHILNEIRKLHKVAPILSHENVE